MSETNDTNQGPDTTTKSPLCTAGLVLAIIAVCTSFIPIVNNVSIVLGVLAVLFGLISIRKAKKGKLIATIIIGIVAIIIAVNVQTSVSDSLDTATGSNTDQVLSDYLDVDMGEFEVTTDEYGLTNTSLTVTLTNKSDETMSFDVQIEAVDEDGNRIDDGYVTANDLGAGQSQEFEIFTYVDSVEEMEDATFSIVEASAY